MPREALILEVGGEKFRFYFERQAGDVLHITSQHGVLAHEAIDVFFRGGPGDWNERRSRYEVQTETHGLYWTRYAVDQSVLVITCFRRGEANREA